MLSFNESGKYNYRNRTGDDFREIVTHAFNSADNEFSFIAKTGESVVAPYGDAQRLIEAYNRQPKGRVTKEKINIIRKLERFAVSLYPWEIETLGGAINNLDDTGVKVLDQRQYSDDIGVVYNLDPSDYII